MNILSQKFTNVLKNRLESKIKELSSTFIDELLRNLTGKNDENNNYLNLISEASRISMNLTKEIIVDVINEYDGYYRESIEENIQILYLHLKRRRIFLLSPFRI